MIEIVPQLSAEFIQTIQNTFGEKGKRWLESLPALLEEASRRWDLTDIRPVPDLSYNFVVFSRLPERSIAKSKGASNVVLRLGVPHRELTSEIAALRYYAGRGVCRLLDADAEKGMLMLERLQPGHMLSTLEDDDLATQIAADVMKNLWEGSSDFAEHTVRVSRSLTTDFIKLKDWFDGLRHLRERFNGGTGPLPQPLVETAESLSRDLLLENKDVVLLHGDFHHYNVLESARGWLAIDPKGVIGPRGYEVGPFLINPIDRFLNGSNPRAQTERRIAILSDLLGMERERIRAWGVLHAVLSAWWCIEGNDSDFGNYSIRCAEIFLEAHV